MVKRCLTLAAAVSFMLITVAIISVYNNPMVGYEYSVYQSAPAIFWIAIVSGLMVGILLFSTYYGKSRRMWAVGLFEILISNFILVSLYIYKGFVFLERSDSLSYIGYAKDVVDLGIIPESNFYPMISILMASMGEILGQSMVLMSQILPAIFVTIYTLGLLCWSKSISSNTGFVASTMLASMPIFFAWFIPSIFHETFCVLMLPLFFYILWQCRTGNNRFKILMISMLVFFVLGHPLVAVGILVTLGMIFFTERMTKTEPKIVSQTVITYSFVLLFGWISINAMIVQNIRFILDQLMGLMGEVSTFGSAQTQAGQLGILSALQSVLVCTIDDIIYVLLALVVGILILRKGWKTHPMTTMMACFIGGGAFLGALVLFTYSHNPFRMINLNFVMIFTVPLVGFLLYLLKNNGRRFLSKVVTVLILFCMVSTVFTIYQDPIELFPNGSITKSEIAGANWYLGGRESGSNAYVLQTNPWRYADLIYGDQYIEENPEIWIRTFEATSHFESYLAANDSRGHNYMVMTTYDKVIYTTTWESIGKFNDADFYAIKLNPLVDRIYENPCMSVSLRA